MIDCCPWQPATVYQMAILKFFKMPHATVVHACFGIHIIIYTSFLARFCNSCSFTSTAIFLVRCVYTHSCGLLVFCIFYRCMYTTLGTEIGKRSSYNENLSHLSVAVIQHTSKCFIYLGIKFCEIVPVNNILRSIWTPSAYRAGLSLCWEGKRLITLHSCLALTLQGKLWCFSNY